MEKNFAIYNEIRAAAERVFNEGINAPAGVYSLAELAKIGTTCKTAPEGVYFREDYNTDELININIEGFECSFSVCHVFIIARRFETLAKVGAKDRAIFTRAEEHGEPVAVFTLDAVTVKNLAACEDPREGLRPQMQGVFCDIVAGLSCCSDGYALNVARLADAQVMHADALNNGGVILSRVFAKAAKGCKVSIYKDGASLRAVASNGASCEAVTGRYPNYKAVFSHVDESRPVRFNKNAKDLKKAFAVVAKTAGGADVFISGLNADSFITVSAAGENGEISRCVALAAPLTFNFVACCKAENVKCINDLSNTLYIAKLGQIVLTGSDSLSLLSPCCFENSELTQAAAAASQLAIPGVYDFNAFAAFVASAEDVTEDSDNAEHVAPVEDMTEDSDNAEHVAPVEDVTEDSDNAGHVAPVEDATEDSDNAGHVAPVEDVTEDSDNAGHVAPVEDVPEDSDYAGHVAPRRVWLDWLKVAAALLLAFVIRSVSTNDSNAESSLKSRAAVVDVEPLQAVEILDTLNVAPVAPVDSIQATEGNDKADTLHFAPLAPVESIQAAEGNDNADTLGVAPVAPVDSIQATEGNDKADTLDVAPVAPVESIQATEGNDKADTLHFAPLATAQNPYIIGPAKN